MSKKKVVISYDNLPQGVLEEIEKQYPDGWANHVMKVQGLKDNYFYAILVDTEEASYLVKVKVKKDRKGIDSDEDFLPDFEDISGNDGNAHPHDEPFEEPAEE